MCGHWKFVGCFTWPLDRSGVVCFFGESSLLDCVGGGDDNREWMIGDASWWFIVYLVGVVICLLHVLCFMVVFIKEKFAVFQSDQFLQLLSGSVVLLSVSGCRAELIFTVFRAFLAF